MPRAKKTGPSFDDLEKSFRARKFEPIYLFHGEEDFLIDQMVDSIIRYGVDEATKGFNLDLLQGSTSDGKDIISIASAFPMMADRRIVIVKEFDRLANKDALLPYIQNALPSTILILQAGKPDFRQKVFQTLRDHAAIVECKQLYESEIPGWIAKRTQARGKTISIDAAQMIQMYVGRSLREIDNEIEKLFIYARESKAINVDDVNAVVGMTKQYNIFELQRAIGKRDVTQSLGIAIHMLDAGENMTGMIVMLTRYFQKLWQLQEHHRKGLSDYEIASLLSIGPFFAKEYLAAARVYSTAQIERAFEALLTTDEAIKSTNPDTKLAMTLLLHQIIVEEEYTGVAQAVLA